MQRPLRRSAAWRRFAVSGVVQCAVLLTGYAQLPTPGPDGSIQVPAFSLPQSSLLSTDARDELEKARALDRDQPSAPFLCPVEGTDNAENQAAHLRCIAAFYQTYTYKHLRHLYPVTLTHKMIGGVYAEVFEPSGGVAAKNIGRVLINVHGGGFDSGARTESHTESVPIASVAKIRVISVDYREAPQYGFPAASEDVARVYAELLKTYKPTNIGIFGCSAGGLLTAETIAWFQRVKLPLPGAIGMFCAGAAFWTEGDSGVISKATGWWPFPNDGISTTAYFNGVDPNDPLAFPARSAQVMALFPPSLLVTGTRDVAMSSVIFTHSLLVAQGVPSELHIWEGMNHAFFFDPDLPESREFYSVTAKFFNTYLGHSLQARGGTP